MDITSPEQVFCLEAFQHLRGQTLRTRGQDDSFVAHPERGTAAGKALVLQEFFHDRAVPPFYLRELDLVKLSGLR